jgi:hypothetical protein
MSKETTTESQTDSPLTQNNHSLMADCTVQVLLDGIALLMRSAQESEAYCEDFSANPDKLFSALQELLLYPKLVLSKKNPMITSDDIELEWAGLFEEDFCHSEIKEFVECYKVSVLELVGTRVKEYTTSAKVCKLADKLKPLEEELRCIKNKKRKLEKEMWQLP